MSHFAEKHSDHLMESKACCKKPVEMTELKKKKQKTSKQPLM
jgi:hypothetical protein